MKNNRDVIWVLTIFSLVLIYVLDITRVNNISSSLLDTIIINLITGCFVSSVIAFIDFKNKFDNTISYFLKEVNNYYYLLCNIEKYLNRKTENAGEIMDSVLGQISIINSNAIKKSERIDLYFIIPTRKKKNLVESLNNIYEITFGIELYAIALHSKVDEKENSIIDYNKAINCFKKMVKEEKNIIDREMLKIDKYNIANYWQFFLLKYIKKMF